jgi:hypothetical protein
VLVKTEFGFDTGGDRLFPSARSIPSGPHPYMKILLLSALFISSSSISVTNPCVRRFRRSWLS